jgi:DNA-binding SARP family transcriptional activator
MEFRLLGPLEVLRDHVPVAIAGGKQRALLALLLLNANRTVSREQLLDALWGEELPRSASKMVQIHVSHLRKALPEPRLRTRAPGYVLELAGDELDLSRFEQALVAARQALAQGNARQATRLLDGALALWRGPALAEFGEPFAQRESARLEELRVTALELRIDGELALGNHDAAVGELEALMAAHPLRERLRSQHMLALYRSGRQAEALAAYQAFRRALSDELGIEPSPALRGLERRMLSQDPTLERPPEPVVPVVQQVPHASIANQLTGSRDADLVLLEREADLAALADAYAVAGRGEGRVVLVSGEPGIGKTSLVARFLRDLGEGARVLVGACDDLSTPRPLGPIRDVVGSISPALEDALAGGAAPHEIQTLLVAELARPPQPTVLVLEDVHWTDDATCDAITVLARRIRSLPALLVLTFRSGEARPGHPLYAAVGAMPAGDAVFVELAPLSAGAVASLAGPDADEVYAATGGNPFYVTELLAPRAPDSLPPSIANAVVARAARLDEPSRRLVELVSVVPNRIGTSLLDAVLPGWAAAAEEPERRRLLEVDPRWVRFRHELARNAIAASVPAAARRRHHAEILAALLTAGADPAEIVHHAEAAGADDVVAEFALVAARRAAALDSNREAYAHFRRAAQFVDRLPASERAAVFEQLAAAAYAVGRLPDAFAALEQAIVISDELGDRAAMGRCRRVLSRLHWYAGDGDAARADAADAVSILEPLGETPELARAYSVMSQLAMLAEEPEEASAWGDRAIELATRFGDESIRAHALVNNGSAALALDPTATATLLEAHAVADAAGDAHEASRALNNLAYTFVIWARPERAMQHALETRDYARSHEVHTIAAYAATTIAWLRLRAGEWDEGEQVVRAELERGETVQLLVKTVLTELAVRRGDPDAAERLAEVEADAARSGELQRIVPVLELRIEFALTRGAPMPNDQIAALVDRIRPGGSIGGRFATRIAAWATVAGFDVALEEPRAVAYHAMGRRDWRAAADAFAEIGWSYDRALMLSLLDEEEALVESLAIARGLGAEPLAQRATARLRDLGRSAASVS